ncbi:MAG: hypothetical protein R3E62_06860 [Pseudomonadales bacterium]|jgi:hypothetical protein
MSDNKKLDQEKDNHIEEDQRESRRRFAKSGIAGGAVLMSLLSRPALGTGYNDPRCTGSILASIDAGTSLHDFDPDECRFGCTPGFWCPGPPPAQRAWNWITAHTGITPWSKFSDIFPCGPGPAEFNDKELFPEGPDTMLEDIICIPNGAGPAFLKQSARHSIAAWLNANILGVFYSPLSPLDVVNGYCAAFDAWMLDENNTGPLENWHQQMAAFNERGNCPLNNDPNNIFYQ